MLAAMRRASSRESSLAAARRLGLVLEIEMPQLFPGRLADDEAGVGLPRRPRRREAALSIPDIAEHPRGQIGSLMPLLSV
jgi:hypothetical protein